MIIIGSCYDPFWIKWSQNLNWTSGRQHNTVWLGQKYLCFLHTNSSKVIIPNPPRLCSSATLPLVSSLLEGHNRQLLEFSMSPPQLTSGSFRFTRGVLCQAFQVSRSKLPENSECLGVERLFWSEHAKKRPFCNCLSIFRQNIKKNPKKYLSFPYSVKK